MNCQAVIAGLSFYLWDLEDGRLWGQSRGIQAVNIFFSNNVPSSLAGTGLAKKYPWK